MKTYLKSIIITLLVFILIFLKDSLPLSNNTFQKKVDNNLPVLTGLDILEKNNFSILKDKKVGLITNQTGLNQKLIQNVELFFNSSDVDLKAIFSPEHGLSGTENAGKKIFSKKHIDYEVPVFSLYGKTRKPNPEMLNGIDVLVFDIQDIGIRSYTYISTMGLAMEAAAENDIEFIVLDRPNPIGGERIEGNLLERDFKSFIGMYPIPYVHGLTIGELAYLINNSGWLEAGQCDLTIIKMKNWNKGIDFLATGRQWIPTSPHVPEAITPHFMIATGVLGELGIFSNGVGYTAPFQYIAAPWINAEKISSRLNELDLQGIVFRPIKYKPYYGLYENEFVEGVQILFTDISKVNLLSIQFHFLEIHHNLYPEKDPFTMTTKQKLRMFDKAMGTDKVRKLFSKRFKYSDIELILNQDLPNYFNKTKLIRFYE